jgi:hypothetical protein
MKRSPRRVSAALVALAAVALVAACGDDDDATTSSVATTASSTAAGSTAATGSTDDTTGGSAATTPDAGSVSDDESDYVNALADNIQTDDRDVATCLAGAIVDAIGFDAIHKSGMSPAEFAKGDQLEEKGLNLEAEQADDLKAAFSGCGEIAEAYISAESVPGAQKECERGYLTNDIVAELLATQLTQTDPSEQLTAAIGGASKCDESAPTGSATATTG